MASENIHQLFLTNPVTTNQSLDLMYFGRSPYGTTNDAVMTFANFQAQFIAPGLANQIGYYAANGSLISPANLVGGTGITITPAGGNFTISTTGGGPVNSITGTALQVFANGTSGVAQSGAVTLTLPQNIATSSSPIFANLTIPAGGILHCSEFISSGPFNRYFFGSATALTNPGGSFLVMQIAENGTGTIVQLGSYVGSGNIPPVLQFWRSTSGVLGVLSPVVNGSLLATIDFLGDDGVTGFPGGAQIQVSVSGSVSSGIVPGQITIKTTNTSGSLVTALTISNAQILTLANPLPLGSGGTNAALTASNGGIVWSNATQFQILAGTATANQILLSGSSVTPAWSTTTYPATNAINTIMYASSANVLGVIAAANSSVLTTSSTGVPAMSGALSNGQLIIGSTGATPAVATLTPGAGISITNAAGSITIASTTSGMTWSTVTVSVNPVVVDNGYVSNSAGQLTFTLPTTFAVGDEVAVEGLGAGGWKVTAGAATTIKIGSQTTSSAGSLASVAASDNVYITGIVANTTWRVRSTNSAGLTIT